MALVLKDRVKETTTTTGTGTYTLAGAVTGFEAFSSVGDGNTTYYACTDGTDFEVGIGTYTSSGTTLARTTILQSSNSDNAVSWSSGTRTIFCTQPAEKAVFLDGSNNISIPGTIDGRDLATDGTKLDGIEASADVTDTTNVTAAGALMDSEVTNLAQVKAFDSSDYATAAQGSTADAALPKAGGTMTGNLELNNANIVFEGSTADADETTLTAIDPTEDRTISLPNQSGTVMVTLGDSYRSGVSQTYSGSSYLVDGEFQTIATVTPSGNSHNYFFSGRIVAQSGQNVHTINITVALRANTLPDLSFTANYDEDVVGTVSQYITPVLYTKETSPASFILAVEVHNTIYGTLTADLDFFARTQADLADISVNTTDGSEITSTPSGYTLNQFTKTTALDNANQFVFNQDVQFTGDNYNVVWDKSQDRLEFADNAAITFGTGNDISLDWDGTDGHLTVAGTLNIEGSGETLAKFIDDGAVELYHNSSKKLETTADGATVTGDITVSGDLFVNGGTIRSEDGTLDFGNNSADNWGQISYQSGADINGFSSQFDNAVRFSNEQGSTNQHMLLLDTAANNSGNIWGVSQNDTPIFGVTGQSHIKMYHPNGSSNSVTISPTTPTADRTITLPDATGTVQLTDGSGASLTSLNASALGSGTVPNARLDAQLQDVAGLAVTNGNFIVGDGSNFVAESGATARTSLGLGTAAVLDTGISNTNVPKFTSGVADNDFLRVDGTAIEGRSASEVLSDIAAMPLAGGTFTGDVTLESTDAGASDGPVLDLYRNSASPAVSDLVGSVQFSGENDADQKLQYAEIQAQITDETDGTEDGALFFQTRKGGALTTLMSLSGSASRVNILNSDLFLSTSADITFEGATSNANETTLTVTDPTADRTITLPDATGTVQLTDGSGASLTSLNASELGSGTVPNARLDAQLQDVAGLAVTNGGFIVGDGSNFVLETGATARTSLGLGTAAVAATGISNGNVPVFTSGVADDDFLRVNGTSIEGRSASELASDIGAATTDDATALAIALG